MNSSETYAKFAQYYDAYVGDFNGDLPLYTSLCHGRDPIVEIGCGTGRVLEPLLGAGHGVTGVDISADMLSIAERKLARYINDGKLTLLNLDFRCAALPGLYACALVTFYTFNYLLDDAEQSAFLNNIHTALADNGLLVLDLFYPRPMSRPETADRWEQTTFTVAGGEVLLRQKRRMMDDIEERIQVYIQDGNSEEIQTLRRYSDKQRMHTLLTKAGFTGVMFTDGYGTSHWHELSVDEATTSSFVVMAVKRRNSAHPLDAYESVGFSTHRNLHAHGRWTLSNAINGQFQVDLAVLGLWPAPG